MSGPVRLERDGGLAVVTFDAPPLNLFDHETMAALAGVVGELHDDLPRAVLIRAEGRVVSGGVDVGKVFDGLDAAGGELLWNRWIEVVHALEELPVPTVFAAHALCLTAAFEVALACDLLLAAESARFGLVEVVVGLTPSMGGPQRLVDRAGVARARELIMTGDTFDAQTLASWNVVNRVLPDEGFAAESRAFAQRLADGPTAAHAATKRLVHLAATEGARAADAQIGAVSGPLFATDDLRGAVRSFLADGPGKATFNGR